MIYISNNLYLTGGLGPDFNDNNPIVGYQSVLTPSDITAPTQPSVRSPENAWTPDTALVWEGYGQVASGTPFTITQHLVLANTNNVLVDYIAFARHNLGSSQTTYRIQSSDDAGANWDDITSDKLLGSDDSVLHYFDAKSSGLFRIRMTKTGNDVPAPIIGHVKLGAALVLQRRMYVGHMPGITKKVKRQQYGSENGQYLGQVIQRSYRTTRINQENNSPSFVRTNILPFINHVNGHVVIEDTAPATFFFAWRPSDYPDEVLYGWTQDNIEPENQGGDQLGGRMSWSCGVEAIA